MKKYLIYLLLLALGLSAPSCRRAVEKARENIRVEAVESVRRQGLTGAEVVLRVKNGTGYKLVLKNARMDVYYAGSRVGDIRLREGVEVPRRTTASVPTAWQLRIADPLALYVLTKRVRENDFSQVAVSFSIEGRGGPAPVNISRDMVPLSEFLNIFGVTLQDVSNYLNPKK